MKKVVLSFPTKEEMAEFVLACKIKGEIDPVYNTVTGSFDDECIDVATKQYKATIAEAPDFILPDSNGMAEF
jgi:hypothetical protein